MTETPATLTDEVMKAIRDKVIAQIATWMVGGVFAVFVIAGVGWWLFLDKAVGNYLSQLAGGVPANAIVASTKDCSDLGNVWTRFEDGIGRFLIGAGRPKAETDNTWNKRRPDGGFDPTELTEYSVLGKAGEETHALSSAEMPAHGHETYFATRSDVQPGPDRAVSFLVSTDASKAQIKPMTGESGEGQSHNIMPPYVAVYFCQKS